MIKKNLLILGISAALIACGGNADNNEGQEGGAEQSQEQEASHDHDGHDHGDHNATEEATTSKEERIMASEGASVFFVNLEDGATVSSPVHVEMGVEGMAIEPAGAIVMGTGHHHILINDEDGKIPMGEVVPMNETNIHFGKGQTETDLELEPGTYTISLQFANGYHESYGEQMSKTITITVE